MLLVPKAALRWSPQPEQVMPGFRKATHESSDSGNPPAEQVVSMKPSGRSGARRHPGIVWILEGNMVRPVKVKTGLSDGALTEVAGDDLQAGQPVVVGELRPAAADNATANPFTPQIRRRSTPNR